MTREFTIECSKEQAFKIPVKITFKTGHSLSTNLGFIVQDALETKRTTLNYNSISNIRIEAGG